jgi:hypothetical protein
MAPGQEERLREEARKRLAELTAVGVNLATLPPTTSVRAFTGWGTPRLQAVVIAPTNAADLEAALRAAQRAIGAQAAGTVVGLIPQGASDGLQASGPPVAQLSDGLRNALAYEDGLAAAILVDGAVVWRGELTQLTSTLWRAWTASLSRLRPRPEPVLVGRWEGNAGRAVRDRGGRSVATCWATGRVQPTSPAYTEWNTLSPGEYQCHPANEECTDQRTSCRSSHAEIELWRLNNTSLPRWTPLTEGDGTSSLQTGENEEFSTAAYSAPLWVVVHVAVDESWEDAHHEVYIVHEDAERNLYFVPAPGMQYYGYFDGPLSYAGDIGYGVVGPAGFGDRLELSASHADILGTGYWINDYFVAATKASTSNPPYRWSVTEAMDTLTTSADATYEAASVWIEANQSDTGRPGIGVWSRNRWCDIYVPLAFVADHPERHGTMPNATEPTTQATLSAYAKACRTGTMPAAEGPTARAVLAREHAAACSREGAAQTPKTDWRRLPDVQHALDPLQADWDALLPRLEDCLLSTGRKERRACAEEAADFADTLDGLRLTPRPPAYVLPTSCGKRTYVAKPAVLSLPGAGDLLRAVAERLSKGFSAEASTPRLPRDLSAYLRAAPMPAPMP